MANKVKEEQGQREEKLGDFPIFIFIFIDQ